MEEDLIKIKNDVVSLIIETDNADDLNSIKLNFLGKNGKLTEEIKNIGKVPPEKRPEIGRLANEIKKTIEEIIQDRYKKLVQVSKAKRPALTDVTLPGIKPPLGHLHLVTQAIDEITEIFEKIGFTRVRYPEIEWDWYTFTALNFPQNHPARDEWETFFIQGKPDIKKGQRLLTPHTSSGQIREMERVKPPIRMLNIAKTYRKQSDISHVPMFHQFEGLVVDKGISMAHLKGTLDYFVKSYFGKDRKTRIRPYHFQFTEPSIEIDVSCGVCNGKGCLPNGQNCKVCKAGWLELGGAGMVHPNVLKYGGINPDIYTGYAFGWGPERCLMMKEKVADDLRSLYSTNLDYLEQA